MNSEFEAITQTLASGGIAVVRTDTIYGIIAVASNEAAVSAVYATKNRDLSKQCIVLVAEAPNSRFGDIIQKFSAHAQKPTSVVVPATDEPSWILRGGDTIAYRVVKDDFLKAVIEKVGPVIAPSANPEGLPPARTIDEALSYFGNTVDCYVDGGEVPADVQSSEIIKVDQQGMLSIIRNEASIGVGASSFSIMKLHHSSGGVVFHDGKVLLIHWDPPRDSYDFPKGTIEPGETAEEACIREVLEETGYLTRITGFIGTNSFDFQASDGEWCHKINEYYLLELVDIDPQATQHEQYETFENVWVPIEEAERVITRDINVEIFKKAFLAT